MTPEPTAAPVEVVTQAAEAPVEAPAAPATPAEPAVTEVPAPAVTENPAPVAAPAPALPPSPLAGFVPGWMPVEFDSVPDESGRTHKVKGHTWGLIQVPSPAPATTEAN